MDRGMKKRRIEQAELLGCLAIEKEQRAAAGGGEEDFRDADGRKGQWLASSTGRYRGLSGSETQLFCVYRHGGVSHYYECVSYRKLSLMVTRIKAHTRDWSIQNVIKSCIHTSWLFPRGEPFLCDRLLEVNRDNASLRGLLFLRLTFLPFLHCHSSHTRRLSSRVPTSGKRSLRFASDAFSPSAASRQPAMHPTEQTARELEESGSIPEQRRRVARRNRVSWLESTERIGSLGPAFD